MLEPTDSRETINGNVGCNRHCLCLVHSRLLSLDRLAVFLKEKGDHGGIVID